MSIETRPALRAPAHILAVESMTPVAGLCPSCFNPSVTTIRYRVIFTRGASTPTEHLGCRDCRRWVDQVL